MAAHNSPDTHLRFAVIYCEVGGVPISFPLGIDGVAHVTSLRLSLRFQMSEDFMFIDVATQDRVFPHYVPNSSIKHSKSDSKDRSQEIL
jgi:hypothetical protein